MIIELDGIEAIVRVRDPEDHIERVWQRGEFYEANLLRVLRERYRGYDFIDVGAHRGNHSLWAWKGMESTSVMSIEPEWRNWHALWQNLSMNRLAGITEMRQCAVGLDVSCNVRPYGKYNSGMFRVVPGTQTSMYRLDQLAPHIDEHTVIKVDVEGHEIPVMKSAKGLMESRPVFVVETHEPDAIDAMLEDYVRCGPYNSTPTYIWEPASR